jgi:hypothetical protein
VSSLSSPVIVHSQDLARLRAEGFEIQVHPSNHVVVRSIPYVTVAGVVAYGTLFIPIDQLNGDVVGPPPNHQAYFAGSFPHSNRGEKLTVLLAQGTESGNFLLGKDLVAQFHFSYKSPKIIAETGKYNDYYDLVTSYVDEMWKYARRVDSSVDPRTGRVDDYDAPESAFVYPDTASSRAGIAAVSEKLVGHTIAIIGVGGTGSYVLDLVSKTPVKEIHIFDGDFFLQHNAFRSPGAAPKEDVFATPPFRKVDYYRRVYSEMRRGIIAHPDFVEEPPEIFKSVDFTFICIDKALAKRKIVDSLIALRKPFIDVGMSVTMEGISLTGAMRTTLSTDACRTPRHQISFVDIEDDYALNIQIADLNALNAALAVIRWKKLLGFYEVGTEAECSSIYTVNFNRIDNGGAR